MSKSSRVYNVTRRVWMKPAKLRAAFEACAITWLEDGISVRDLTLAESIAARNQQAKLAEPLPAYELYGVEFRLGNGRNQAVSTEKAIAAQARVFAQAAVHNCSI